VSTLDYLRDVRRRVRTRAHAGVWFPVGVIAVLLLGSIALYVAPFAAPYGPDVSFLQAVTAPSWAGLPAPQRDAGLSYGYWFVGTPAAFAVIAWWYRRRARRVGLTVAWRRVVIVGLGALAGLAVLAAVPSPTVDPYALSSIEPGWLHGLRGSAAADTLERRDRRLGQMRTCQRHRGQKGQCDDSVRAFDGRQFSDQGADAVPNQHDRSAESVDHGDHVVGVAAQVVGPGLLRAPAHAGEVDGARLAVGHMKRRDQRAPNRGVVEESVDEHERRRAFLLWVHDETSFLLWFTMQLSSLGEGRRRGLRPGWRSVMTFG